MAVSSGEVRRAPSSPQSGLRATTASRRFVRDQLPLLDNLLDQVALALERGRLEGEAREFARVRERDQVRSVLLSSIGQDLEPPLKAITDAVRELRRSGAGDKALVSLIGSEAAKLERYLANLLELGPESDRASRSRSAGSRSTSSGARCSATATRSI